MYELSALQNVDLLKCNFSLCISIYTSLRQQAQIYKLSRKHKDFSHTRQPCLGLQNQTCCELWDRKDKVGSLPSQLTYFHLTSGRALRTPCLCSQVHLTSRHPATSTLLQENKTASLVSLELRSASRLYSQFSPSTTAHSFLINSFCLFYNSFFYPLLFSLAPTTSSK